MCVKKQKNCTDAESLVSSSHFLITCCLLKQNYYFAAKFLTLNKITKSSYELL